MSLLTSWSRTETIAKLESIVTRAYDAAGKLREIQCEVDRSGVQRLKGWDFGRSSGKAYDIADNAREALGGIVHGGPHIPARLMTRGCESALTKYEKLIREAEAEGLLHSLKQGQNNA